MEEDSEISGTPVIGSSVGPSRGRTLFDAPGDGGARPTETSATLRKLTDMVRRIMRADTVSIASFSVADKTVTWRAMSGFQTLEDGAREIVNPLRGEFAERAAEADETIIEVRGLAGDLPASEFPLHSAEGLRDLTLAPLKARGETLGVMVVGYRASHRMTPDERRQLEGLAEMAALALDNARLFETIGAAKRIWEQTFDAIPDGIIVHDDRMRLVRCNLEAAEMMDMLPAETIGMSCADAFARLFGERAAAYHMKQSGARTTSSFELQSEDGRRYLVAVAPLTNIGVGGWGAGAGVSDKAPSVSDVGLETNVEIAARSGAQALDAQTTESVPLRTSTDTHWSVITWSDITALSEVQEQLARTRRLATVGQLAAGVAHEINNPLASITTCAEATLRALRTSPETAALASERNLNYYLEEIVRQTLRCKEITRGLLDLSRQRRARREPVELNSLVEQSVRLFDERGGERGVTFSFAPAPDLGEVATDEAMVRQVLDNLLSNALDAAGEGGRVSVSIALDGGRVVVEVADDGPGIAHETLSRVFDPFFTTKDPGRGSGLGLAISLTLAEAMGGALTVESKTGAGTRFRLWLPRHAPEQS
ncbi:MAG: ATP-binding protein [Pyrinomonadaceae bacterium]